MATLERAILIAADAHAGQMDKGGNPYVLHPLRVMLAQTSIDAMIVGVLHDVVEDTPVTYEDLRAAGFSEVIIEAVASVTKDKSEKEMSDAEYEAFVLRAAANPIGRKVKLADMRDNSDLSRIARPVQRDFDRLAKYAKAIALMESLDRG